MTAKTVYQYDHAGRYAGTTTADESPLEPGVYLYPARTTELAPPEPPVGKWPRWTGAGWDLVNNPAAPPEPTPAEKLALFLKENPDVTALIES